MYNAAISFARDMRRRLSGAAATDAGNDDQPEDFSNHHAAERAHDDDGEEGDDEECQNDDDYDEDDVQMPVGHAGLVDYDSDEAEDDGDDNGKRANVEDDGEHEDDIGGPSVDDLFAPGELERRMAEEAAGIDPYADEFAEAPTEVDDDDLAARRADFDEDDVPEISEEERAATDAIYAEIRRKVAEDEAARAAAYDTPYVASPSSSSSSAGSNSTSTGSDWFGPSAPSAEPLSGNREFRTPPPQDLAEPTTPVFDALPLAREELVVPTPVMVTSLVGAARGLILRTMLGRNHRTVTRPSRHGPPTPFTSPRTSPAPDLGIDEADNSHAQTNLSAAPRNALRRTMNADYFQPDGNGGFFAMRAQHHVSRPWELSYEETARLNERRRVEAAAAAASSVPQPQPQPAPPARSPSVESDDVDMAGYDTADEPGDCSPSPVEGTSSQVQQDVEPPANVVTPPASPSPRQKRARSEDDLVDDGALAGKRRRVETEAQPGSPAAARARAGTHRRIQARSPTVATRSTIQVSTAMTASPAPRSAGPVVAEPDADMVDGYNELPIASPPAEAVAGPSRQPATASPSKRPSRRRGRAVQKAPTAPTRRSTRIRKNEAARAKAAEDVRAAAAVAQKRGKRGGNGRA